MIRKILKYPHPALRMQLPQLAESEILELSQSSDFQDLYDTLRATDNGAAIAHNQVFESPRRLFLVHPDQVAKGTLPSVVYNPTWAIMLGEKDNPKFQETENEGCLSFPGISIPVPRYKRILVDYYTVKEGKVEEKTHELTGFEARMYQHECDHLDGKLFVDYISKREKFRIRSQMMKRR